MIVPTLHPPNQTYGHRVGNGGAAAVSEGDKKKKRARARTRGRMGQGRPTTDGRQRRGDGERQKTGAKGVGGDNGGR